MFSVRNLKEEEYPILCQFWAWWRFPIIPREFLPHDLRLSVAVIFEGDIICVGFLYPTPSSVFWSEFIVSNPDIKDKKIRADAIRLLIDSISGLAKKMNAKIVFTSLKNENLKNHYIACGYIADPKRTTELTKIL